MLAQSSILPTHLLDEYTWLQRYLSGQLHAAECAWFEAYLITREPLVAALERVNEGRDTDASRYSCAQNPGAEIQLSAAAERLTSARQLRAEEPRAASGQAVFDHRRETGNDRRGRGSADEESTRADGMRGIGLHVCANHVAARGNAEQPRNAVTAQRVAAHVPAQIGGTDSKYVAPGCRLFDPVAQRITVSRCRHDQDAAASRQPPQGARENARIGVSRALEAEADRQDLRAGGDGPGGTDLDRETIAAPTVLHDLGNHQTRLASDAVPATAVGWPARAGDDASRSGAVAVGAAIVHAAVANKSCTRGNPPSREVCVVQVQTAVEHTHNHAFAGGHGWVQPQRLRCQGAWPDAATFAICGLLAPARRLWTIDSQAMLAQVRNQTFLTFGLAHKNRGELGHEQWIAYITTEPEADQIFAQLRALVEQPGNAARGQREALLELPALGIDAHLQRLTFKQCVLGRIPDSGAQSELIATPTRRCADPRPGTARGFTTIEETAMPSIHNRRRSPSSTLIAVLSLGFASIASAGQPACLTRGSGADEHFLGVENVSNISDWLSQGALLVHNTNNMSMCSMPGTSCSVANGDIITISATDNGKLVLHRTRPTGAPLVRDIATMLPSANGRYLSGYSQGTGGGQGQQVFLYYTGTAACTDSGLPYPIEAQCRSFEFEVFPVNVLQGDRPDAQTANWASNTCPGAGQQPGSGGTIEPPKPPR